jgi:hypothetical protein
MVGYRPGSHSRLTDWETAPNSGVRIGRLVDLTCGDGFRRTCQCAQHNSDPRIRWHKTLQYDGCRAAGLNSTPALIGIAIFIIYLQALKVSSARSTNQRGKKSRVSDMKNVTQKVSG